jgi:hypothetical protein
MLVRDMWGFPALSSKQRFGKSLLEAFNQDRSDGDVTISSRRYLKAERNVAKISGFVSHIADFRAVE